jgi:hypothetical protein
MTSNIVQAAGGVKRLTAAVFIAQRFDGTGPDRKPVPRTPEDLEKLRHIVQSALGLEQIASPDRQDEITLEEMPFNDQPVAALNLQLDQQEKRQFWMDLASKLIYPALGLGVLLLFWRLWKSAAKDEIPIGLPLANGNGNGNGRHKNGNGGVVTVEVLNQLIRENPANMTQAVRSWLARGKPEP